MKRLLSSILLLTLLAGGIAAQPQRPEQREDRRTKVIIDNDLCGDADGLFALAHQLLCKSVNIRATFPSAVKYDLRPSFGLRLLLTSPKFSAIAWSGSNFFILPNSLFSNVDR